MANVSVTNTFANGAIIQASEHNTNFSDLVTYINNRNSGSSTWDAVSSASATNVPGIFNNSTGTQNILRIQDNGTNVLLVDDGGATTITATGSTSVPLVVNNGTSTGNVLNLQDNGTNILTAADGGVVAITANGGSGVALTVNNGTSTGNVLNLQDNGTNILTAADGGAVTVTANGGSGVPLTVNNGTSTGDILRLQDNGSNVFTMADGGVWTTVNQSACRVVRGTSDQNFNANTITKVQFNSETYDVKGEFDSATNFNFTATVAGKYLVTATVYLLSTVANDSVHIWIFKNDAAIAEWTMADANGGAMSVGPVSDVVNLAATDTIDIRVRNTNNNDSISSSNNLTWLAIHKIA